MLGFVKSSTKTEHYVDDVRNSFKHAENGTSWFSGGAGWAKDMDLLFGGRSGDGQTHACLKIRHSPCQKSYWESSGVSVEERGVIPADYPFGAHVDYTGNSSVFWQHPWGPQFVSREHGAGSCHDMHVFLSLCLFSLRSRIDVKNARFADSASCNQRDLCFCRY